VLPRNITSALGTARDTSPAGLNLRPGRPDWCPGLCQGQM